MNTGLCGWQLNRTVVVPAQGFEPWTLGLKGRCSARLSYTGTAPF
jgi:hypothetical protein